MSATPTATSGRIRPGWRHPYARRRAQAWIDVTIKRKGASGIVAFPLHCARPPGRSRGGKRADGHATVLRLPDPPRDTPQR